MIAVCNIKATPHYRSEAFIAGLQAVGYEIVTTGAPRSRLDVLVIWNRQGAEEGFANTWESQGGAVIVCENGYAGRDADGQQLYAVAVHGHNGSGWHPVGADRRFGRLGVDVAPWRDGGAHVLVCGQRGIGSKTMASPVGWEDRTAARIRAMGFKKVVIRRHPGRFQPKTSLDAELDDALVCVVWSSASGVRALIRGVPVVYCAPHWICAGAAGRGLEALAAPPRDDALRAAALERMAHAQWAVAEIAAGEPFRRILEGVEAARW